MKCLNNGGEIALLREFCIFIISGLPDAEADTQTNSLCYIREFGG